MNNASFRRISNRIPLLKTAVIGAPILLLATALYTLTAANSTVATGPSKNFAEVTIKNFGQMDEHFYRGAQPKEDEYKELAALGIKLIIDLRDDPMPYAKAAAEAAKMRYFNLAMSDKDYPKNETIDQFLTLIKEDGNRPFYVHCAGGRHRTGLMGAIYRFNNDGWDYNKAYQEMKNY